MVTFGVYEHTEGLHLVEELEILLSKHEVLRVVIETVLTVFAAPYQLILLKVRCFKAE